MGLSLSSGIPGGRYVWLPLWVLPLPASEPGPPVDVVVRWHDSWHVTDFERAPRPRKVHPKPLMREFRCSRALSHSTACVFEDLASKQA